MSTNETYSYYTYKFKFTYFIPGGFGDIKRGEYLVGSNNKNYAEAVNKFNNYCSNIFHNAVTIVINSITRKKNPIPF